MILFQIHHVFMKPECSAVKSSFVSYMWSLFLQSKTAAWTSWSCMCACYQQDMENTVRDLMMGRFFRGVPPWFMSCHAFCPGSLQIWYHLQTGRDPDVFSPALGNLADGRLHRIRIHRVGKNLYVQVSKALILLTGNNFSTKTFSFSYSFSHETRRACFILLVSSFRSLETSSPTSFTQNKSPPAVFCRDTITR